LTPTESGLFLNGTTVFLTGIVTVVVTGSPKKVSVIVERRVLPFTTREETEDLLDTASLVT
jgi:hypothetical protein